MSIQKIFTYYVVKFVFGWIYMERLVISGGCQLNGEIEIGSSKNAILPIIAATILTKGKVVLHKVPNISDVKKMLAIIESLGGLVQWSESDIIIDNSNIDNFEISSDLTSGIRSSIFILGPLIAMYKKAKVAYPGGCDIGSRPIGIHLSGLRELNVKIVEEYGFIDCEGFSMKPKFIHLDFPSVGATENLIMASVLHHGETILNNVAKEPEVVDLINFINKMGGKIEGAGTSTLRIVGVKRLNGIDYTPIGDRIIAGTYMIASAITRGKVELSNIKYEYVLSLIDKLKKSGCNIEFFGGKILVESFARPKSCSFDTGVYPGFPTDLQPQLSVLTTVAKGTSMITENLFETRFRHFSELAKMGAMVECRGRTAIVRGVKELYGTEVDSFDLRGGASMVLAGLIAKGRTVVNNIEYIDRGYSSIEGQLQSLGADIIRINR